MADTWVDKAMALSLIAVLVALALVLGVFAWKAATGGLGPSCEQLGGRQVLDHYQPITTGKATTLMPIYRCEIPAE